MRIGILGGGQLAMMMVESANKKFGFEFIVVDPAKNPPASKYAKCIQSQYDDIKTLDILSSQCDLVTIDFENVPSESLRHLEKKLPVFPNPTSLDICQDRLNEKNLFKKLNIATTNYKSISSKDELKDALDEYSFGSILKSRKLGYDGKNQIIIDEKGLDRIWDKIDGVDSIIENKIDFDTEVSLIGARTHDKKTFFYPLIENFHENGILSISISPLSQEKNIRDRLQIQAEAILNSIMNELNYIGVLVIEFFLDKDLNLL